MVSSRRGFLGGVALAAASALPVAGSAGKAGDSFVLCLNSATLIGLKLPITRVVDIAAKAGFKAIEPWTRELGAYVEGGGSLADLRKRIADHGMTVESAIAFPKWAADDDGERGKALEQMKREVEMLAAIGGKRIACPPAGLKELPGGGLLKMAERYRAVAEIAGGMGVVPQVECWGSSKALSRLGEAMLVAIESGYRDACVLPDVYHMYKGGSDFDGLRLLSAQAVQVMHINDYPADPPRETITDGQRVYPGDGVAPLPKILADLRAVNPRCVLSLELFNKEYWKQEGQVIADTGLRKVRAVVGF